MSDAIADRRSSRSAETFPHLPRHNEGLVFKLALCCANQSAYTNHTFRELRYRTSLKRFWRLLCRL